MTLYDDFQAAGKAVLDAAEDAIAGRDRQIAELEKALAKANARIVQLDAETVDLTGKLSKFDDTVVQPIPVPDPEA